MTKLLREVVGEENEQFQKLVIWTHRLASMDFHAYASTPTSQMKSDVSLRILPDSLPRWQDRVTTALY